MPCCLKVRMVSFGVVGISIEQLAAADLEATAAEYLRETLPCTDACGRIEITVAR